MVGRILSHYRILEHLGSGGMGMVYKAEDTRLKRSVALKFLPPALTRDLGARERFMREARAASSLDHPNICTIFEIDTADEGQLFIAMGYYQGETLKQRLDRGQPLPIPEALDIAIQIARGLDKAHHAGIFHRDIKPANVMLTADGLVKIVDFGIAKLMDHTGSTTRTNTILGTVAYMSPEQCSGTMVDSRSDLWAVGVVLYEMLTGRQPFTGDHELATLNNILNRTPEPIASLRAEVPGDVQRVIERVLAKRPEERYATAAALIDDLEGCRLGVSATATGISPLVSGRRPARHVVAGAAIAAALAVALPAGLLIKKSADAKKVDEGIGEVTRLAGTDQYAAALARAEQVERLAPDDTRLVGLWDRISVRRSLDTVPPGADVFLKPFDDVNGEWRHLGQTPIAEARLPRGVLRWKFQKDGYYSREFIEASPLISREGQKLTLLATGTVPADMVLIEGSDLRLTLTGYDYTQRIPAGDFLIDTYEVTNRHFKDFVDAGGYSNQKYWKQEFIRNGRVVSWDHAMTEFRDRTGRPGPSTWEVGTYPTGQDSYPVSGVSWYEAAAYAEFKGKSLPTVYHWLRAGGIGQAAYITPLSNFEGKGPSAVGSHPGISPAGAMDMAGNVKEWCWNEMAGKRARYILGGSWSDRRDSFVFGDARSPFERSEAFGFRLVEYLDTKPLAKALVGEIAAPTRDYTVEKPVDDRVFQAFRTAFAYDQRPLEAKIESDETAEHWVKETVTFRAVYGDERVTAFMFLPRNAHPPFHAVVHAPGAYAILAKSSNALSIPAIDYLVLSGRAVLFPIYKGTFERNTGQTSPWPQLTQAYQDWIVQVVNDARRAAEYLETREDVKHDSLAYHSVSWGSSFATRVLALEPRFKAAVLLDGALSPGKNPPMLDPINYAPRVTIPVLMVNGDNDFIYPVETLQKPLFALLSTPPEHKRHVLFPSGHGVSQQQRSKVVKEVLDWLDRYQGPIER